MQKYKDSHYLLSEFLNRKEDVADMIKETLDYNDLLEIRSEEAREEGLVQGLEQGIFLGVDAILDFGVTQSQAFEAIASKHQIPASKVKEIYQKRKESFWTPHS